MIRLGIIGATGSIGRQALEVLSHNRGRFHLKFATAHTQSNKLAEYIAEYNAKNTAHGGTHGTPEANPEPPAMFVTSVDGSRVVLDAIHSDNIDVLLVASEGLSGFEYTYQAAVSGVPVALANKESLVLGGHILMPLFDAMGGSTQLGGTRPSVVPVDSEHSAIFQCLLGQERSSVRKIVLTASGGPFRKFTPEMMTGITREMALTHPNWSMGQKITVDSSTMMNKGLELIEARYLFGVSADELDVVIHGESIVHSYVVFKDGSTIAQMGEPSMLAPIAFALGFPHRLETGLPAFDMVQHPTLTFEPPDTERFPALRLAMQTLRQDKPWGYIGLNAANDIAVAALLKDEIKYGDIAKVVEHTLSSEFLQQGSTDTVDGVQALVGEVQSRASSFIKGLR